MEANLHNTDHINIYLYLYAIEKSCERTLDIPQQKQFHVLEIKSSTNNSHQLEKYTALTSRLPSISKPSLFGELISSISTSHIEPA